MVCSLDTALHEEVDACHCLDCKLVLPGDDCADDRRVHRDRNVIPLLGLERKDPASVCTREPLQESWLTRGRGALRLRLPVGRARLDRGRLDGEPAASGGVAPWLSDECMARGLHCHFQGRFPPWREVVPSNHYPLFKSGFHSGGGGRTRVLFVHLGRARSRWPCFRLRTGPSGVPPPGMRLDPPIDLPPGCARPAPCGGPGVR